MATTGQHRPVWIPAREYPAEPASSAPARTVRRIATLERNSPRLVNIAARAGVDITYLGIAELFAEPRAYPGQHTDWIIGPAGSSDTVIPIVQKERLQKLLRAGIGFPHLRGPRDPQGPGRHARQDDEHGQSATSQARSADRNPGHRAGPAARRYQRTGRTARQQLPAPARRAPRRRAHRRSHRRRAGDDRGRPRSRWPGAPSRPAWTLSSSASSRPTPRYKDSPLPGTSSPNERGPAPPTAPAQTDDGPLTINKRPPQTPDIHHPQGS